MVRFWFLIILSGLIEMSTKVKKSSDPVFEFKMDDLSMISLISNHSLWSGKAP